MPVTPDEILADARAKADAAGSEVEYRHAAHCLYYAAFHHLMRHPACAAFGASRNGGDHKRLIEFLKAQQNATIQTIGHGHLRRLRSLRNKADYGIDEHFSRHLTMEALDRTMDLLDILQSATACLEP